MFDYLTKGILLDYYDPENQTSYEEKNYHMIKI
jgi:hypothetical protein